MTVQRRLHRGVLSVAPSCSDHPDNLQLQLPHLGHHLVNPAFSTSSISLTTRTHQTREVSMEPLLVSGPDGTVVVRGQSDPVRPHGFMVQPDGESVILELLG